LRDANRDEIATIATTIATIATVVAIRVAIVAIPSRFVAIRQDHGNHCTSQAHLN
jgi:hypothetical protein